MIISELIAALTALPQDMECMVYYEDALEFRPLEIKQQLLIDSNENGEYSDRDVDEYSKPTAYDTEWKLKNKLAYDAYISSLKSKQSKTVLLFKPQGTLYLPAPEPPVENPPIG